MTYHHDYDVDGEVFRYASVALVDHDGVRAVAGLHHTGLRVCGVACDDAGGHGHHDDGRGCWLLTTKLCMVGDGMNSVKVGHDPH